jgi:predicted transcriptional regulator
VVIVASSEGIESLFFDLSSESRLGILSALKKENLKMNELARRLDLTATEAFRQLQRLSEAQLVEKQPEGTYALTQYCRLVLQLSPALEFVYRYKMYFLTRDIWRIPNEFLNRIGELSAGSLSTNVADSINHGERMVRNAEEYVWTLHDRSLDSMAPLMLERYKTGGMSFRFMFSENEHSNYRPSQGRPEVEERMLPTLPAIIVSTEKEAAVCLLSTDGRADYAGFFGTDTTFRKWVNDLFLHYWSTGKKVSPS